MDEDWEDNKRIHSMEEMKRYAYKQRADKNNAVELLKAWKPVAYAHFEERAQRQMELRNALDRATTAELWAKRSESDRVRAIASRDADREQNQKLKIDLEERTLELKKKISNLERKLIDYEISNEKLWIDNVHYAGASKNMSGHYQWVLNFSFRRSRWI